MFVIDRNIFLKATGVDFQSEKGLQFRGMALRSLKQSEQELINKELNVKELAHKIKGIALLCGATELARVCSKLEHYRGILTTSHTNNILQLALTNMIALCQSEE